MWTQDCSNITPLEVSAIVFSKKNRAFSIKLYGFINYNFTITAKFWLMNLEKLVIYGHLVTNYTRKSFVQQTPGMVFITNVQLL